MPVQSAQSWFVICIAAGVGIFCTFIRHLFARARARLLKLDVRPPQAEPLLRSPGHTLTEQLFQLIEQQDQKTVSAVTAALLASILLFPSTFLTAHVVGAPAMLSDTKGLWIAVAAAFGLIGSALSGYRAFLLGKDLLALKKDMHAKRLGLRGEQAVAEALHSLEVAGAGYVAFHDVPKQNGGNIDHVVVGPGGVFVIETKARSQQKPQPNNKRNRIKFNGKKIEFPSGAYDFDAAKQTQRNAAVVSDWLEGIVEPSCITPLLVYPGWEVHMIERCAEIKAMSANQLRHFFRSLAPRLDAKACDAGRRVLDAKCRDVLM